LTVAVGAAVLVWVGGVVSVVEVASGAELHDAITGDRSIRQLANDNAVFFFTLALPF
jgi:hypothetical protein